MSGLTFIVDKVIIGTIRHCMYWPPSMVTLDLPTAGLARVTEGYGLTLIIQEINTDRFTRCQRVWYHNGCLRHCTVKGHISIRRCQYFALYFMPFYFLSTNIKLSRESSDIVLSRFRFIVFEK